MSLPAATDGRFQPGRSGNPAGRPPGIADRRSRGAEARAEKLGIDPIEILLLLAADRWCELHPGEPEVDAQGGRPHVPLELRLQAAKAAAAFLHPRLKAVEVEHAAADENPFAHYMAMPIEDLRKRIIEIDHILADADAA